MSKLWVYWSKISLGARVGLGFLLVSILGAVVILTGMHQMYSINARVSQFIYNDSLKVELVHQMIDAANTRMISSLNLSREPDPFIQETEYVKFTIAGDKFVKARREFSTLPLDRDETNLLEKIRDLAAEIRPDILGIIDDSIADQKLTPYEHVISEVTPKQRLIIALLTELLEIQQDRAYIAANQADAAYTDAWLVMSVLCGVLGVVGIAIVVAVIRLTNRQAGMLSYQALYDSLTGLPNRSLFTDRLQQTILTCRRAGEPFALIVMDLNLFKEINDSMGHQAGDEVLKHVARICRKSLRESDTVARMGGDEFSIMMPSTQTLAGAEIVAKRLLEQLREAVTIQRREIEVSASIGIAMFPRHAEDIDELQSIADAAMYQAKRSRTGYAVYNKEMSERENDVLELQSALRKALIRKELVLHYQPKIEFATRRISGVEALIRWHHPQRGMLLPDVFIPIAENSDLIRPITEYVLRMAVKQAAEWLESGRSFTVAVNVSTVNIQDEEFAALVETILHEANLPANLLELEITESAVMSRPELAVKCIQRLYDMGVHVAIDDFGTGYTSMSQLKGLLVTKIKIDRVFIKNMVASHSDSVIVRTAVDLSHNLGFKVIAEGVEDQETWDQLETLGCDSAQGFHMAVPLSPEDFDEWLQSSPWGHPSNKPNGD